MSGRIMERMPASVRTSIATFGVEPPEVLLPEDHSEFMQAVADAPECQVAAEQAWNAIVDANEAHHRYVRSRQLDANPPTRKPYFLTVNQIATRWNMSARTVWRMVKDGRLRSILIGSSRRVLEEDVEKCERARIAVA